MEREYSVRIQAVRIESGKYKPEIVVSEVREGVPEDEIQYTGYRPRDSEFDTEEEAKQFALNAARNLMKEKYGDVQWHLVETVFIPSSALQTGLSVDTGSVTATDRFLGYLGQFDPKPRTKKR